MSARIGNIRAGLARGFDEKLISRLKHYYLRIERSTASNESAEKMKSALLGNIKDLLEVNKALGPMVQPPDPLELTGGENISQDGTDEADELDGTTLKTKGVKKHKRSLGAITKGTKEKSKESEQEEQTGKSEDTCLKAKIAALKAQVETLSALLKAKMQTSRNGQTQDNHRNENSSRRRELGAPSEWRPRSQRTGQGNHERYADNDDSSSAEDERSETQFSCFDGGRRPHREDRVHYDRKMEKWNLFFAGDT